MRLDNIVRRLNGVTTVLSNIDKPNISSQEKSVYYRCAQILLSTIIEGLTYEYVEIMTRDSGHILNTRDVLKPRQKLNNELIPLKGNFWISEQITENITLNDKQGGADFGKLIIYLKNHHLVSPKEYSLLNWVRIERNKIHVQGLSGPDIGYSKKKLDKITNTANLLLMRMLSMRKKINKKNANS